MRQPIGTLVCTTGLVLALAACGGSGDSNPPSPTPSSLSSEDTDELAKIATGQAPTDLTWRLTSRAPSSWKRIESQNGIRQWQVAERCSLSLEQPAGLGTRATPDSGEIAREYVRRLGQTVKTQLTAESRGTAVVSASVAGTDATTQLRFARVSATGPGGLAGDVYAYRGGNFALVLIAFCGADQYTTVEPEQIRPFLRTLSAAVEY